jgi:predicted TIM-barrel fold metal-dependent hydrolase
MPQHVIDFRCRPPLPAYGAIFELQLKVLGPRMKNSSNRGAATISPSMHAVGKDGALELWWKEIDEAGVQIVVCNGRLSADRGSMDADGLAHLQKRYSGRLFGLAPINLEQDVKLTVRDCERAIRELGLRGFNIEPTIRERGGPTQIDNSELFPIYETAVALDVPIMVYTGPFAAPGWGDLMMANDMVPYDRVLQRFPKLKIVLGHGAYPNIVQVLGAAFKHPNLYVCPDLYTFCAGGELYRQNIAELQDQFIYGSSYPFGSIKEPLEDTLRLPLSKDVMEKYLWGNAARLLKLGA